MKKKLILFSNSSDNIVKLRKNLLLYLWVEKYDITICIPEIDNNEIINLKNRYGFNLLILKYHRSSLNIFSNFYYIYKTYKILIKNNFDLILTFTIKPNILVSIANIFIKKKIINVITGLGSSFFTNIFIKNLIIFLYKVSLSKSNSIIFQNYDDRDYFINKKIVSIDKSYVILGSGVDTKYYSYSYKKFDKKNIKFLYAGRLIKDKGVIELIKTFKKIVNINNNVKLTIAGKIDTENPSKIENDIINNNNSNQIEFVGNIKNLKDLIIESDFCVLLSYREGLSNFLIESASVGRPLITTNVPGCKEIVDNNNGFICEKNNIRNAIDIINKSTKISDNKYQQMSISSRKKALEIFDNKIVLNKYLKIINNIIS